MCKLIVKRKEDICAGSWCRLTEENLEYVKQLGFKTEYNKFLCYLLNPTYCNDDIFLFGENTVFGEIGVYWGTNREGTGPEIIFTLDTDSSNLSKYGFKNKNNIEIEIVSSHIHEGESIYYGIIKPEGEKIIPSSWDSEGNNMSNHEYDLEPLNYKQRIYTKPNNPGFLPKQKFKVSWTRDMSSSLEDTGWRLATDEEIEGFKCLQ